MSCDIGEVIESSAHSPSFPSLHYVTAHSLALTSLYLRHGSFSNPSFASLTSPGEPPIITIRVSSLMSTLALRFIKPPVKMGIKMAESMVNYPMSFIAALMGILKSTFSAGCHGL